MYLVLNFVPKPRAPNLLPNTTCYTQTGPEHRGRGGIAVPRSAFMMSDAYDEAFANKLNNHVNNHRMGILRYRSGFLFLHDANQVVKG